MRVFSKLFNRATRAKRGRRARLQPCHSGAKVNEALAPEDTRAYVRGISHSPRRNSEIISIVPTTFSFNFSRSAAGIQYSRCSELPTVWTYNELESRS